MNNYKINAATDRASRELPKNPIKTLSGPGEIPEAKAHYDIGIKHAQKQLQ